MKKILIGLLSILFATNVWADTCATKLIPAFTAAQATSLCTKFGSSIAISQLPQTDNTYDLGSASKQWRTGYFGTSIINSAASADLILGKASVAADAGTPSIYDFSSSATASQAALAQGTADTAGVVVDVLKSRKTDGTADTIVVSGDTVGTINFKGANGATFDTAAKIVATIDGTPGASADMPGAIDFQVSADGSATPASALKITNDSKATFAGTVAMTTATSKIIPGATAFVVRDNSDANSNLSVTNAGVVTGRTGLVATTGGVTITTSGDFVGNTSGSTLSIQEATAGAACSGSVTANGVTPVATSTTCWTTGSHVFLTKTSTSAVNGSCYISATSNGVSFTITCLATDTGTYGWFIIHEAP